MNIDSYDCVDWNLNDVCMDELSHQRIQCLFNQSEQCLPTSQIAQFAGSPLPLL